MKFIIFIFSLLSSNQVFAFDYFGGQIDYWKEHRIEKTVENKVVEKKPIPKPEQVPKVENKKFDWSKYLDPKNPEFFKEGEHTPPEPLMELARNPSDENIKLWFAMVDSKNKLMGDLQKRLTAYSVRHSPSLGQEEKDLITDQQAKIEPSKLDFKRFRFRLYFESSCPHCRDMLKTMKDFQDMGYYVEAKQIDDRRPEFAIPFPIIHATKEELKAKNISSWPVLFVADTNKQLVYRINGYFPTQELLTTLSSK